MTIIAPEGSPLSVAVVGVKDMETSLAFYRDMIGLQEAGGGTWSGEAFESFWHLPDGSAAETVLLKDRDTPIGRILLVEFDAAEREEIRKNGTPRGYGLVNLNFYTPKIAEDAHMFADAGFELWSDPTFYDVSSATGSPTELIFEGPDTVAINLVELSTTDEETRIGQMAAYVRELGFNDKGFTAVVTSAHTCRDIDKAVAFYKDVLKMDVLIDEIFDRPVTNHFLRLPEEARTKVKFMQGAHMFGKIALSEPLNYDCDDFTPRAHAPNIGYIAQVFEVTDMAPAVAACEALDVEVYSKPQAVDWPGLGPKPSMIVRNPGSGALQAIVER